VRLVKSEEIARAQGIPTRFLLNILTGLCHAGIVHSQRGSDGGYRLARSAASITVADIVRAVDGDESERPTHRHRVWALADATLGDLLNGVTLEDLIAR
jgi:Rrf2 family protein